MRPLLIIGGGGHARVVADILRSRGEQDRLIGFIDAALPIGSHPKGCSAPVLGRDDELSDHADCDFIIGMGSIRGGDGLRAALFDRAVAAGLSPLSLIHPSAVIADDVTIGRGTAVMAGVIVNTGSVIGDNVILNSRASVDHDARIRDHVHIAPGATLSGDCQVGQNTLIGVGAVVRQGIDIGANATIAAGAVVVSPVMDRATVSGVPARP